jgi:ribonuclease III
MSAVDVASSAATAASPSNVIDPASLPYNPSNVLIQEVTVAGILKTYGSMTRINDLDVYRKAMVHRSYCTRKNENFINGNTQCPDGCLPLQEESNERLEFLGDAVINLVVAKYLFERYPDENEGFLTKLRTKLVNGTMLAQLCRLLNITPYIMISKQIEEGGGRCNTKVLEDVFEAFVGAMYMDHGMAGAEGWIINLIETNLDFSELIGLHNNHKDALLKYFQHNFSHLPKFLEINVDATAQGKLYTVCIRDKNDTVISTGFGSNKKQAENDAARNALLYYGQVA